MKRIDTALVFMMYQLSGVGNMICIVGNLPPARSFRLMVTGTDMRVGCFRKSRNHCGTANPAARTGAFFGRFNLPSVGALGSVKLVSA